MRDDKTVDLRAGQPMVFGKQGDKGVQIDAMETKVVAADQATVWDPKAGSAGAAFLLSEMDNDPSKPRPIGIFRDIEQPVFDTSVNAQVAEAIDKKGAGKLKDLVYAGDTWTVG